MDCRTSCGLAIDQFTVQVQLDVFTVKHTHSMVPLSCFNGCIGLNISISAAIFIDIAEELEAAIFQT